MSFRSKEIQKYQELELKKGIFNVSDSFHSDFQGCPFIIVRGLNYSLSEGDICTIFEQYGTIVGMELIRDEKTGISKGTAIIKYENPDSAILAVDNFNGISLLGRIISVDHVDYKYNEKSNLTDPRKMIPARLRDDKANLEKPVFDPGSASSTDDDD